MLRGLDDGEGVSQDIATSHGDHSLLVDLEVLKAVDIGGKSPGGGVTRRPVDGESLPVGSDNLGVVGRKVSGGNLVGGKT